MPTKSKPANGTVKISRKPKRKPSLKVTGEKKTRPIAKSTGKPKRKPGPKPKPKKTGRTARHDKPRQRVYKPCPPDRTKPVMKTAESLRSAIESYFEWCNENPWLKAVAVDKNGDAIVIPKARPYLVEGLCRHIGISRRHWYAIQGPTEEEYRPDLADVTEWATVTMFEQKVSGAVVDDYKENIVARLTGLGDRKELTGRTHSNGKTDPIELKIDKEVEQHANDLVRKLME